MKAHILFIGMVDTDNNVHYVEFVPGVNVITGKSSTGKSAMLEIFDYCMGSSENNIPHGQITSHGTWFFTVLSIKSKYLMVARNIVNDSRYINEESVAPNIQDINKNYFKEEYQISNKKRFNPELGRYFNLTINDIEEDIQDREYRTNNTKKGRPSIRNIMPFLLQHQNLIANKHAIFYRFDENKKREDTIEQFKIFVGFVKDEYFTLKQSLADLTREKKSIERIASRNEAESSTRISRIKSILDTYFAMTNNSLFPEKEATPEYIYNNYRRYLELISHSNLTSFIDTDDTNDASLVSFNLLKNKKVELETKKRSLLHKALEIERTIDYTETEFIPSVSKSSSEFSTVVSYNSQCCFCNSENNDNYQTANKLNEALNWLNSELAKTNYHIDSFRQIKTELDLRIKIVDDELKIVKGDIASIESIKDKLKYKIDLDAQANRYIGKLEAFLESLYDLDNLDNKEYERIAGNIRKIEERLKNEFNVDGKIITAEKYINKQMKEISEKFDFEKAYQPINLKFSLTNFDLYHKTPNGDKVFLRSMGSGANWLYSHLSLFLALHRYFCKLGDESIIPPILFLDQPTQVYFPANIEDSSSEFNAKELVEKRGKVENFDEDMKSVTNIFEQLISFCNKTKEMTNIMPQIIVTDHADNLELENDVFEDLVVARWRNRGFIHPLPDEDSDVEDNVVDEEQSVDSVKDKQLNLLDPPN